MNGSGAVLKFSPPGIAWIVIVKEVGKPSLEFAHAAFQGSRCSRRVSAKQQKENKGDNQEKQQPHAFIILRHSGKQRLRQ
jgi:hypothetical protein